MGGKEWLIRANAHFHLRVAITVSQSIGMSVLPPFPRTISGFIQTHKTKRKTRNEHAEDSRDEPIMRMRGEEKSSKKIVLFWRQQAEFTQVRAQASWMTFAEFHRKKKKSKKTAEIKQQNRHERRNWLRNYSQVKAPVFQAAKRANKWTQRWDVNPSKTLKWESSQ